MATDTQQIITDHLQFASEVLPEIAASLRLLSVRAEVLSEDVNTRILEALEIADRRDDLVWTRDMCELEARLSQPGTRIILVREEAGE